MAVVHSFPSTSWLDATDGTSNSSSSQSPAPAASAQASTWHHDEERTSLAKKKKEKKGRPDTSNSLSMAQHVRQKTRCNITHRHTLSLRIVMPVDGLVVALNSGGSEGRSS